MEVGKLGGGPTTSNSRPIRAAARYLSYGPNSTSAANFSGPVRRWHKTWVPVSVPQHPKNTRASKPHHTKTPNSSILLCKWTPLSSPADSAVDAGAFVSPRRKFRFTPIAAAREQKKVTAKRVVDQDPAEKTHLSRERLAMDSDENYEMVDINDDLNESPRESSKNRPISQYSRRN